MNNSRLPYVLPALRAAAVSAGILVFLGACAQDSQRQVQEQQSPTVSSTPRQDARPPLLMGDGISDKWREQGSDDVSEQDALESCNAYANAIVARDRRIETDRNAGLDTGGPLSGSSQLGESMRIQGEKNAYEQHFSQCMENRGYAEE